ncbi:MAG: hypothetical protein ACOVQX_06475 [Legionella sp.]
MYALDFPNLYRKYSVDNFEVIIKAISIYFNDWFQLDVLNNLYEDQDATGSYEILFNKCMQKLAGLYTEKEVAIKLWNCFQDEQSDIKKYLLEHYIFVPTIGAHSQTNPRQLSFLEKLAVGALRVAEPLEMLDIMRALNGSKRSGEVNPSRGFFATDTTVINLKLLLLLNKHQPNDQLMLNNLRTKKTIIINLNRDLTKTAKWGVIDLRQEGVATVYCESPLLERERSELENYFGPCAYEGARADSAASTGYAALAWFDLRFYRLYRYDLDANFSTLLEEFILNIHGHDNPGLAYKYLQSEARYLTNPIKQIFEHPRTELRNEGQYTIVKPGFIVLRMSWIANLGRLNDMNFLPGDLLPVINHLSDQIKDENLLDDCIYQIQKTMPPSFGMTLADPRKINTKNPSMLTVINHEVRLVIPQVLECQRLREVHISYAKDDNIDGRWLDQLWFDEKKNKQYQDNNKAQQLFYGAMMVQTLVRSKAKKRKITIEVPDDFRLDAQQSQFIISTLQQNAYVTEFIVSNNQSLQAIRDQLLSLFARNRWLAQNNYLPPLTDQYWKRAVKFWLTYLSKNTVLASTNQHDEFKRCVKEMGCDGLKTLLAFLCDPSERDYIDNIYGKRRPAFYMACLEHQYPNYLQMLRDHIKQGGYFPYGTLSLSFDRKHQAALLDFLQIINESISFDKIVLTDCLNHNSSFREFLSQLSRQVQEKKWLNLIEIPELDNPRPLQLVHFSQRQTYLLLNNIILTNRRTQVANNQLKKIEDCMQPLLLNTNEARSAADDSSLVSMDTSSSSSSDDQSVSAGMQSWPLNKGGAVQLQLQQQQQIEQSRQVQQQQQKLQAKAIEMALINDLVTYQTIDHLLGDFLAKRQQSLPQELLAKTALLKGNDKTLLQNLFHTWINANPNVSEANYVIQAMTQEAAKELLMNYSHLASGLNPDNLPKGFFTQRSKNGHLVLGYDPELSYISYPNALTLDLTVPSVCMDAWKGNFYQLNLDYFLDKLKQNNGSIAIGPDDWEYIKLFVLLQPKNLTDVTGADQFFQTHFWLELSPKDRETIKKNWPLFMQVWVSAGESGLRQLLSNQPEMLTTDISLILSCFFKLIPGQSQEMYRFLSELIDSDEQLLKAFGQIFYSYGTKGLTLFCVILKQLETDLGSNFFAVFTNSVLRSTPSFNQFMTVDFFTVITDMIEQLRNKSAEAVLTAWTKLIQLHFEVTRHGDIQGLWRGFAYFIDQLAMDALVLKGDEFNKLQPHNMLVLMDRILTSVHQIKEPLSKESFLHNLAAIDLTHGGVYYALQYEQFSHISSELKLSNFESGQPTYAPNLKEIYRWDQQIDQIMMLRVIASQGKFNLQIKQKLIDWLNRDNSCFRDRLIWLLHSDYDTNNLDDNLSIMSQLAPEAVKKIAKCVHQAICNVGDGGLNIHLQALIILANHCTNNPDLCQILDGDLYGIFLEALSLFIVLQPKQSLDKLMHFFHDNSLSKDNHAISNVRDAFKLATLFNVIAPKGSPTQFLTMTSELLPIVKDELHLLCQQLFSIDSSRSNLTLLSDANNWQAFLNCIQQMKHHPGQASQQRIAFIGLLNNQDIHFKYSKNGDFRALEAADLHGLNELSYFVDHQDRLSRFLQQHIVVHRQGSVADQLQGIVAILKKLQLNRTYLNEIEPLLSILESTKSDSYWSAEFFHQLLLTLQPDTDKSAFPISLLKVILGEKALAARRIDDVTDMFPTSLNKHLKIILQSNQFDRRQQAMLSQLCLREFDWQQAIILLPEIISVLSAEHIAAGRSDALEMLSQCQGYPRLVSSFNICRWLVTLSGDPTFFDKWPLTVQFWLNALSNNSDFSNALTFIQTIYVNEPSNQKRLLHIVAWSSLAQKQHYDNQFILNIKQLIEQLYQISTKPLELLARCYPGKPSPDMDDLFKLINQCKQDEVNWKRAIDRFLRCPSASIPADYGQIGLLRSDDFERMLVDTRISAGNNDKRLNAGLAARTTFILTAIKRLEQGQDKISNNELPIAQMSQDELKQAFTSLSHKLKHEFTNDLVRAQLWAVVFEVIYKTTAKYPHLAQQYGSILNDLFLTGGTRVIALSTGEGKSHFVAMRAAWHAANGMTVDVQTAKRALAEREVADYQSFFAYLGFKAVYIHPKSQKSEYIDAQIHYSTLGDLSLFLDEQSYIGQSIQMSKDQRVALFDEFDFIYFDEGQTTAYNYARSTGKTPKQMTWLYQAVCDFYQNAEHLKQRQIIDQFILKSLSETLQKAANGNDDRLSMIRVVAGDDLQLVEWLQSVHQAYSLEQGVHFTVRDEYIDVGEESYPMQEIIPLSTDNQKMIGSTFTAGVQQLLAIRLNLAAKVSGRAQNYHIHPESNIISSKCAVVLMQSLWSTWEGFTGTISPAQAEALHVDFRTQVVRLPTNQRELRSWHQPLFFDGSASSNSSIDDRMTALASQMLRCLEQKKSILLACKHDKHVDYLKRILPNLLGEYHNHCIFYTNEESRCSADVLTDKRRLESWMNGEKKKGIALIASGFGRGDNVEVEAVFLMDVKDLNDQLQKGGRTARNGQPGEVFQFYLRHELRKEEQKLIENLGSISSVNERNEAQKRLAELSGESDKHSLQRVLLLREYLYSSENAVSQHYRLAIGQLSLHNTSLLATLDDLTARHAFGTYIGLMLKQLDKKWVGLNRDDVALQDKIDFINVTIPKIIESIVIKYQQLSSKCEASIIPTVQPIKQTSLQLVVPQGEQTLSDEQCALINICKLMVQVNIDSSLANNELTHHLSYIEGRQQLQALLVRIADSKSWLDMHKKIALFAKQIRESSPEWLHFKEGYLKSQPHPVWLIRSADESMLTFFNIVDSCFIPTLQTAVVNKLVSSLKNRLELAHKIPILRYLGQFSIEQQQAWGNDFINCIELVQKSCGDRLSVFCAHFSPMSYSHFVAQSTLLMKIPVVTDSSTVLATKQLMQVVKKVPEQWLALFASWEKMANVQSDQDKLQFFIDYCRLIEVNPGFVRRLAQFNLDSWKTLEAQQRQDIIVSWNLLAQHANHQQISNIDELLGKLNSQRLTLVLTLITQLLQRCAQHSPLYNLILDYCYDENISIECLKALAQVSHPAACYQNLGADEFLELIRSIELIYSNESLSSNKEALVELIHQLMEQLSGPLVHAPLLLRLIFIKMLTSLGRNCVFPTRQLFAHILTVLSQYPELHDKIGNDSLGHLIDKLESLLRWASAEQHEVSSRCATFVAIISKFLIKYPDALQDVLEGLEAHQRIGSQDSEFLRLKLWSDALMTVSRLQPLGRQSIVLVKLSHRLMTHLPRMVRSEWFNHFTNPILLQAFLTYCANETLNHCSEQLLADHVLTLDQFQLKNPQLDFDELIEILDPILQVVTDQQQRLETMGTFMQKISGRNASHLPILRLILKQMSDYTGVDGHSIVHIKLFAHALVTLSQYPKLFVKRDHASSLIDRLGDWLSSVDRASAEQALVFSRFETFVTIISEFLIKYPDALQGILEGLGAHQRIVSQDREFLRLKLWGDALITVSHLQPRGHQLSVLVKLSHRLMTHLPRMVRSEWFNHFTNPILLQAFLTYCTNPSLDDCSDELLADLVLALGQFQLKNTQLSFDELLQIIRPIFRAPGAQIPIRLYMMKHFMQRVSGQFIESPLAMQKTLTIAVNHYSSVTERSQASLGLFNSLLRNISAYPIIYERLKDQQLDSLLNQIITYRPVDLPERVSIINNFLKKIHPLPPKHCSVLVAMLSYSARQDIGNDRLRLCRELLLKVDKFYRDPVTVDISLLLQGVDNAVDNRNNLVLKHTAAFVSRCHCVEPLFDSMGSVLSQFENNTYMQQLIKDVSRTYYRLAKRHHRVVADIMSSPELENWFAFTDDINSRNQRIVWMWLLQNRYLDTTLLADDDLDDYRNTAATNELLLQAGYDQYLKYVQTTLGTSAPVVNGKGFDLSLDQQNKLLDLTNEMRCIGRADGPVVLRDDCAHVNEMRVGLRKLMSNYQSSWFKSSGRKQAAANLTAQLTAVLDNQQPQTTTRYEQVLNAIRQAKLAAMDEDSALNLTRWFKQNRGGQSRYFNTLNQMESLVLRYFSTDLKALPTFKGYHEIAKDNFCAYSEKLLFAINHHLGQGYGPLDSFSIFRKIVGYITNENDVKITLQQLRLHLEQLNRDVIEHGALTQDSIVSLTNSLKANLSRLPGHLQTLANELLIRGESFSKHLDNQRSYQNLALANP